MPQTALLELPANTLLEKFGAGSHAPGSGSAAALMGILSSKLLVTVASLSLQKIQYRDHHAKIAYISDQITTKLEPRFRELFEEDAKVFDTVIKERKARDVATDETVKRRHRESALEHLRTATEIPIDICRQALTLIDHGTAMFDLGFKSARGDTGAAISAAVAAAMSGIFVANLNLKSFRGSDWAQATRQTCDELHRSLQTKQTSAFERVMTLRAEDVTSLSFVFDKPSDRLL